MHASRCLVVPALLLPLFGCTPADEGSTYGISLATSLGTTMTTTLGDGDGDETGDETGDGDGDGDGDGGTMCGDGMVEGQEQCDLGPDNNDAGACTTACRIADCGDGLIYEGFEECDDGNPSNTDDCLNDCHVATCGDGVVHEGVEQCDDGNDNEADGCTQACTPGTCGDGIIQAGEQCDDGNMNTSDACPACQLAFCGDSYVQAGVEQCDDGNLDSDDACTSPLCEPSECGDGHVWAGVEECDDGNVEPGDECTDGCTAAFCGDGVMHEGVEECDDGNNVNDDFCTNQCLSLLWFVSGPQTNVPPGMLGGWTECWSSTYNQQVAGLTNTILGQQCTGSKLLLACRQVGQQSYALVAMGDRADVLFDVGNQPAGKHEANGVAWYYSNSHSMGFARAGDTVARNSCDTANVNPQDRLCWHTSGDAINGGYRCGATSGLNGSAAWERKIFHAN